MKHMKKWGLFFAAVVIIILACIYLFIPSTLLIKRLNAVNCRSGAAFPTISKDSNWARWWPGGGSMSDGKGAAAEAAGEVAEPGTGRDSAGTGMSEGNGTGTGYGSGPGGKEEPGEAGQEVAGRTFVYKGDRYRLSKLYYHYVDIAIQTPKRQLESRMSILPFGNRDSLVLQWECSLEAGMNPFVRVQRYWEAKAIATNLDSILSALGIFLGDNKNIYGVSIMEGTTPDSTLVVMRSVYSHYPTTADVYALLDKEKTYVAGAGARPSEGYPMMNVTPANDRQDSFRLMVALPIDRRVPGTEDIRFLRLVPGHYLIADVDGGERAIARALAGMQNYIRDYQRSIMAVPFQSMITNRSVQLDTNLWKTRIYYPIQ